MDASTPKLVTGLAGAAVLVKTGPTELRGGAFYNPNDALVFLQCFDAAAAEDVTPGTTTPMLSIPIPATGAASPPTDRTAFQLGLCVAATTTDTGGTGVGTGVTANFAVR